MAITISGIKSANRNTYKILVQKPFLFEGKKFIFLVLKHLKDQNSKVRIETVGHDETWQAEVDINEELESKLEELDKAQKLDTLDTVKSIYIN